MKKNTLTLALIISSATLFMNISSSGCNKGNTSNNNNNNNEPPPVPQETNVTTHSNTNGSPLVIIEDGFDYIDIDQNGVLDFKITSQAEHESVLFKNYNTGVSSNNGISVTSTGKLDVKNTTGVAFNNRYSKVTYMHVRNTDTPISLLDQVQYVGVKFERNEEIHYGYVKYIRSGIQGVKISILETAWEQTAGLQLFL